jgi:hypothetical protein
MFERAGLNELHSISARWVESLSDLLRRGEAFAMVIVLHVAGVRPAG